MMGADSKSGPTSDLEIQEHGKDTPLRVCKSPDPVLVSSQAVSCQKPVSKTVLVLDQDFWTGPVDSDCPTKLDGS